MKNQQYTVSSTTEPHSVINVHKLLNTSVNLFLHHHEHTLEFILTQTHIHRPAATNTHQRPNVV